jgi:AraC-like DNA-binding protein
MSNSPFILPLITYGIDVQIHQHSAYQLVYTMGQPFTSLIGGVEHSNIFGFLIKPQVPHLCTVNGSTLCTVNVEPYSNAGLHLHAFFAQSIDAIVFKQSDEFSNCFGFSVQDTSTWLQHICTTLNTAVIQDSDERVETIIEYIQAHYSDIHLSPELFSKKVFLSPSRLAALFKAQTGSSLSKYLLWTRIRHAITLSLSRKDLTLTEIAHETGFYDLPQLNKYMYEMFGVPPRGLKQNSDLIQVF